jgi:hypothetical protein
MCRSEYVAGKEEVIQLSESGDSDLAPPGRAEAGP